MNISFQEFTRATATVEITGSLLIDCTVRVSSAEISCRPDARENAKELIFGAIEREVYGDARAYVRELQLAIRRMAPVDAAYNGAHYQDAIVLTEKLLTKLAIERNEA